MDVKISLNNSKLGKIPTLDLPALTTCRCNAPCAKGCYARKIERIYKNSLKAHQYNLASYMYDSKHYFDRVIDFIDNGNVIYKYFRFHSSGDIVDIEYLKGIVRVAKKCSMTKFLVFTKKYELVNEYFNKYSKPKNLQIILSAWDKNYVFENPHNFPVAYVDFRDKNLNPEIPQDAYLCEGDCSHCVACWGLKKGKSTVFHQH